MTQQGAKLVQFQTERVIIGHDESNPELEPLFANHFELMRVNTDIYMDIGIIAPLELVHAVENAQDGSIPTMKFNVLQRVVMSPATFAVIFQKMKELHDLTTQEAPDASPTEAEKK